ncbi:hypothetical protein [Algoriphagus persicinus]|uniref:hypothetical protein n=1 Tax=Algoriphagus persicinus TaxID=3108754 RepID=UPI002B37BA04|nr:hypothetical protein [Algoriphagus sp. E1-3-M2]MEB2786968.1 hypothetical protein [Algoriphagus sp. E1-3-M2]
MIDLFDTIYTKIENRNKFLSRVKYYAFLRFVIRSLVNILAPLYFLSTRGKKENSIRNNISVKNRSPLIIVTMTSFPARINRVWLVIETLLRQTQKPDRIILWISKEQFASIDQLPARLTSQKKRGLEIRIVEGDLKSHKKYYYTLKEFPHDIMITIDDDIFYRSTMIEDLYNYFLRFPTNIISQYCKQMTWTKNELTPYNLWLLKEEEVIQSYSLFFGTGGGTLIPPKSMYKDVLNEELFMALSPTADDVWLNSMCQLNNTMITQTKYYTDNLPILNMKKISLASVNVSKNHNDLQLKAIREYYIKNKIRDPFFNTLVNSSFNIGSQCN